jgi:lipoic acid synthetase
MVGLGETDEEISETLKLIKEANVDLVTIGQYLAPSEKHLKIDRYPEPEMYDVWAQEAIALGFHGVASGPLVRSSYKAGLLYRKTRDPLNQENLPGAYVLVKQNDIPHQHTLKPILHEVEQ